MAAIERPDNRIKELRNERDWTVRDLAERTGIDFSTISRMERGHQALDLPRMRKIAKALGVKPSALLNDDEVEFRAGDMTTEALVSEIADFPADDRPRLVMMARELVGIVRRASATGAGLAGDVRLIGALSDNWNSFDDEKRKRGLELWRAAGLVTD